MLTRLIREDIIFDTILCSEIGLITADPGQIEQVIMNLALNTSDAMSGKELSFFRNHFHLRSL